jgi:phosphoglycolate phosphatase
MSQKFNAILLDLDGTLVNTLYSLQDTMNKTMEKFGFDPITMEQTKKICRCGKL